MIPEIHNDAQFGLGQIPLQLAQVLNCLDAYAYIAPDRNHTSCLGE